MEEKELQEARLPAFQIRDPVFELSNHGDYLLVKATVSGFRPEDLEITVKPDGVTVRGDTSAEESRCDDGSWRQAKTRSAFIRTISFPEKIDPQSVEVTMDRGQLTMIMPKQTLKERTLRFKPQGKGKFMH